LFLYYKKIFLMETWPFKSYFDVMSPRTKRQQMLENLEPDQIWQELQRRKNARKAYWVKESKRLAARMATFPAATVATTPIDTTHWPMKDYFDQKPKKQLLHTSLPLPDQSGLRHAQYIYNSV